ncbi:cytochrome P450 [Gymnopus androsaceus JB14]|uniref:Cytochrome P450 n=1 Tax=Gymnopus androsaceus JB14 TaxID=1447944 RepID=A0A6A4IFJ2_9AGAR|nr:cytochrome P450 [Gymnopus androsaceus JB14]
MLSHLLLNPALILGAVAACFLARFITHFLSTHRALRHVPGPRPSSLIWGDEWLLYHSTPGIHYVRWHRQYGKVLRFTSAFGHQVLSITDPKAIKYILGEAIFDFPKPKGVRAWFKATLGEGILWVEGKDAHERQRRLLAPALSQTSVRNLVPIFYETSAKMACQWIKVIDDSHSDEAEIEVTKWAGRFALDTVGRAAFSYDLDCLSGGPHALAESLDGLTNNENKLSSFYMRALFWIFPSILSIGAKGEMIRRSKFELGNISSRMWRDAKVTGDVNGKDLMSMILHAEASSTTQKMNEAEVVAQMTTTISAGYETVSAIIAWTLYELALDVRLQNELREEVTAAGLGDPSYDDLNSNFPLLDAIVREVLRLHPPILENHHEAAETISVPLSEPIEGTSDMHLVIPKGTILEIPVNVIQTDPDVWGSDAEIFRPERWLERKKQGIRNEREIFAFSEGPRSCIGKVFALCEVKALVVTLLRQFSFTCPHEIEPFQSFVIRPRIKGQGPSSLPLLVRKI